MGIFGKDAKPEPPPQPGKPAAPPVPQRATLCVVGAKTVIKGELSGEEDVVVEGTVEGEVRIARDLRVAQGGRLKAKVSAQSVVLAGEMVGDCNASQKVEITPTGRLTGDIRAPRIVIAEGAVFKGNSDMSSQKEPRKEQPVVS